MFSSPQPKTRPGNLWTVVFTSRFFAALVAVVDLSLFGATWARHEHQTNYHGDICMSDSHAQCRVIGISCLANVFLVLSPQFQSICKGRDQPAIRRIHLEVDLVRVPIQPVFRSRPARCIQQANGHVNHVRFSCGGVEGTGPTAPAKVSFGIFGATIRLECAKLKVEGLAVGKFNVVAWYAGPLRNVGARGKST